MRKLFLKAFLFVFIALCSMPNPQSTANSKRYNETDFTRSNPQLINSIEKLITDVMTESKIIGMSAALVDEKSILWAEGFGYTDKNKKNKVDADTIFSIQSISKSITATAVIKAVQDGVMDLDRPITDYLHDFRVNSAFEKEPEKKITLRHLLSHTAGFAHESSVGSNFDPFSPSFEEHIKSISDTWLKFPVGENYAYSNLGIDLAGYILQMQTGKKFDQYVDENILKPAGMSNSSFDVKQIINNRNRAVGHGSIYWRVPFEIPMIPSGGFYSSAADMAKFVQLHLNSGRVEGQSIIKSNFLNEMYNIPFPLEGQTEGYALGIAKSKAYKTYVLNHNGGGFGFLSSMTWYPELKLGVLVLSNTISDLASYPENLAWRILDRVINAPDTIYNSRLKEIEEESLATSAVTANGLQENLISNVTHKLSLIKAKINPTSTDYRKYTGSYIYSMYGTPFITGIISVHIKDNILYANNDILTEVKDGVFYMNSGEVLDLSNTIPSFRNIKLKKLPFELVWYAVFIGACILSFISLPFIGKSSRNRKDNLNKIKQQRLYKVLLGLNILPFTACLVFLLFYALYGNSLANGTASQSNYVQLELLISIFKCISLYILIMLPKDLIMNVLTWRSTIWSTGQKIHYSVITVFCIIFAILLHTFNLILI